MAEDAPILIVGAGPVGLTAALELTRRGRAVKIIDRDGAPSPESRALGVNPRTLDLLEPSGVTDMLLARTHRVHHLLIREDGKERIRLALKHMPHRFNFLAVLPQSDTEKTLIEALAAAGVAIHWNTELASMVEDAGKFLCDSARYLTVIGADGAHSLVRKSLGIGFPGEGTPQMFSLADVELDTWPYPFDTAVGTLYDTHICAFLPMGEGFGRFIGSMPDVAGFFPPDARVRKINWQSEFRISYRQVETYQRGQAYLAGDAAHIHSPVGGRGMNLGIEDSCWLAWLIAEGRGAEYTALRHGPGQTVLAATHQLTNFISSRGLVSSAMLRWVVPQLLGLPPLRRGLLGRLAGLDTPFPPWLDRATA